MYVRPATLGDLPAFVALAKVMHAESSTFRECNFDEAKLYGFFGELIEKDHGIVYTLVKDGETIGGFVGILWPNFFGHDIQASDIGLFIHPEHRGGRAAMSLIRAFIAEAKEKGARQIMLANSTGVDPERIAKLFESAGLSKVGYVLSMLVPKGEE